MRKVLGLVMGLLAVSPALYAETSDLLVTGSVNEAVTPAPEMVEVYYNNLTAYPKRPRVDLNNLEFVSPSQLHEVSGSHAAVGGQFKNSGISEAGLDTRVQSLNVDARGMYGWKNYTAGLTLGYQDNQITPDDNAGDIDTIRRALVVTPQFSATMGDNMTVGLSGRIFSENVKFEEDAASDRDADLVYGTVTAGLSYHDERKEFGMLYTTSAKASEEISDTDEDFNIYRAPVATIFARGNMTDSFSVFGSSSYVVFERATAATSGRDVYDRHDLRDRIGGKLGLTFWTVERSKFSIAGNYSGGLYTGPTSYEEELGYAGLVNRYGFEADLTMRIQKDLSLSIRGGLARGERRENFEGTQISERQQRAVVGTSINVWL